MTILTLVLLILIFAVLAGFPILSIIRKAGLSDLWSILGFIPIINIIVLWIVALKRWPSLDEKRIKAFE